MEVGSHPEESQNGQHSIDEVGGVAMDNTGVVVMDDLCVCDMRQEAEAVVKDVRFAVATMGVATGLNSAPLTSDEDVVHINLETLERQKYTLEMSTAGIRVVGHGFDQVDADDSSHSQYFETVYSLLDSLSPAYRQAFGSALLQRLSELKQHGH